MVHPLAPDGALGRIADLQLRDELPDLPDDRRARVVEFVCRRANGIPGPLRLGLVLVSAATDLAGRRIDPRRIRALRVPVVGELPRLVRSLGVAFVWESWPDSGPTGRPDGAAA